MDEVQYKRDIEEPNDVLEGDEPNSIEFWEKKQRELITSVVDYNLTTLSDLITSKAIDLAPEYQRRFRWDPVRQSKLIESLLMNVPVPPIFLNEDTYGQYSVIDGKQRLNSIHEFMRGRLRLSGLEIFSDINGATFDDLPLKLQTVVKTRPTLRVIIILRQSDEDVKFEVFQRLNTGGVRLNPQEIRNSTCTGTLNNLIIDLSVNKGFHRLLGIKNKEKSAIYQEMRDAEFVLRYFTFRDTWQSFKGGMRRCMDRYMATNRHLSDTDIDLMRGDFLNTLNVVEAGFGPHAFHRWQPERGQWRQQVLASLYDAQMFACRGLDSQLVQAKQDEIVTAMKGLCSKTKFRQAIDSATNTPTYFRDRINFLSQELAAILDQ